MKKNTFYVKGNAFSKVKDTSSMLGGNFNNQGQLGADKSGFEEARIRSHSVTAGTPMGTVHDTKPCCHKKSTKGISTTGSRSR